MTEPLEKVDSAVQGLASSPPKEKANRRASSAAAPGVYNVNDLGEFLFCVKHLAFTIIEVLLMFCFRGRRNRSGDCD